MSEISNDQLKPETHDGFPCAQTTILNPLDDLIKRLHNAIAHPPQESLSYATVSNSYYPALFGVLCDRKLSQVPSDESIAHRIQEQSNKLDSMIHEFYQFPSKECASSSFEDEQSFFEYNAALKQINDEFVYHTNRISQHNLEMRNKLLEVLQNQKQWRPVSAIDTDKCLEGLRNKHLENMNELKQIVCHKLMISRSRFDESRKKRRNFSKHATEVLTRYFNTHVDSPYPNEEDKEKLALECHITVAQVSNWFGNKRIRFKRSLKTAEQGAINYNAVGSTLQGINKYPEASYDSQGAFGYPQTSSHDPRPMDFSYSVPMGTFDCYQNPLHDRYSASS